MSIHGVSCIVFFIVYIHNNELGFYLQYKNQLNWFHL